MAAAITPSTMGSANFLIREAKKADFLKIWEIFHAVVEKGDTYVFFPETTYEEAENYWMAKTNHTYVATLSEEIVGTYIIKPNQIGLGGHVANGSYMVHGSHQGKKIGSQMGHHSITEAKRLGFKAMQFNMVVSTNTYAVRLWQNLGFKIIGTIPLSFNHKTAGLVDAHVMHLLLE